MMKIAPSSSSTTRLPIRLVPVTLRAWLSALAVSLRGEAGEARAPRWLFWLGLALLLAASCALEWTRLETGV